MGAESEIIVRAVCATKLPTLTFEDNRRFRALLGDLFPGEPSGLRLAYVAGLGAHLGRSNG